MSSNCCKTHAIRLDFQRWLLNERVAAYCRINNKLLWQFRLQSHSQRLLSFGILFPVSRKPQCLYLLLASRFFHSHTLSSDLSGGDLSFGARVFVTVTAHRSLRCCQGGGSCKGAAMPTYRASGAIRLDALAPFMIRACWRGVGTSARESEKRLNTALECSAKLL